MASNEREIIRRYGDGSREENRSSGSRSDYNMEYKYTKKILGRYISKDSSVLELGCGTGYYGIYLSDRCDSYIGIDIVPANIDVFRSKIKANSLDNVKAYIGDATNLKNEDDEKYEVVLALGPMYHLPPVEVEQVFKECTRVCKTGGIIIVAYITKVGVYINACLQNPKTYPSKSKNQSILYDGIDDGRDSIYWFFSPEEIEEYAKSNNLHILDNLGVDFTLIPDFNKEIFPNKEAWEMFLDYISTKRSNTGFANHAVMVCKK